MVRGRGKKSGSKVAIFTATSKPEDEFFKIKFFQHPGFCGNDFESATKFHSIQNIIWRASKTGLVKFLNFQPDEMPLFSSDIDLAAAPPDDFLGSCRGGNRCLFFLAIEAEEDHEARLAFLKKILAALQLDLDADTAYCVLAPGERGSYFQILKKRGAEKMVAFGLPPAQFGLGFEARPYEPLDFYGCRFLFSEKLSLVEGDQARKQRLWAALKAL